MSRHLGHYCKMAKNYVTERLAYLFLLMKVLASLEIPYSDVVQMQTFAKTTRPTSVLKPGSEDRSGFEKGYGWRFG